jgi:hypothetical protein
MDNDLDKLITDFTLDVDDNHFGWMSPEGKFYQTGCMEHLSFAREAAKTFYGSILGADCLKDNGWLAIHPYGVFEDYLFDWRGHLTEEQKRVIKPFVEKYQKWIGDITKQDLLEELDIEPETKPRFVSEYIKL